MQHFHQIIGGFIVMVAIYRESRRHPEAKTLADLDNEQ